MWPSSGYEGAVKEAFGVSIFPVDIPYEQWGAGHRATNGVSQPSNSLGCGYLTYCPNDGTLTNYTILVYIQYPPVNPSKCSSMAPGVPNKLASPCFHKILPCYHLPAVFQCLCLAPPNAGNFGPQKKTAFFAEDRIAL